MILLLLFTLSWSASLTPMTLAILWSCISEEIWCCSSAPGLAPGDKGGGGGGGGTAPAISSISLNNFTKYFPTLKGILKLLTLGTPSRAAAPALPPSPSPCPAVRRSPSAAPAPGGEPDPSPRPEKPRERGGRPAWPQGRGRKSRLGNV